MSNGATIKYFILICLIISVIVICKHCVKKHIWDHINKRLIAKQVIKQIHCNYPLWHIANTFPVVFKNINNKEDYEHLYVKLRTIANEPLYVLLIRVLIL